MASIKRKKRRSIARYNKSNTHLMYNEHGGYNNMAHALGLK